MPVRQGESSAAMGRTTSFGICAHLLRLCDGRHSHDQTYCDFDYRPFKVPIPFYCIMLIASLFSMSFKRPTFFIRINSLFRYVVYRKPRFLFGCPPGAAILIVAFGIFTIAWIFSVHPYYNDVIWKCGSPLLSVRAGWYSLSTTPIIFALAMKRNAVTVLTGISYEKLNVYHRCMKLNCCR